MKINDQAKHWLACLAYEVQYLRQSLEQATGVRPAPRYTKADPEALLKIVGYPMSPPEALEPVWDPPELDPVDEGPVWSVAFERKYLGESELRRDVLETHPYSENGNLVSSVSIKFPISAVEWVRLVPERLPLDKDSIVLQAENLIEEFESLADGSDPDGPPAPEGGPLWPPSN